MTDDDLFYIGQPVGQVNPQDPSDSAIDLALLLYGMAVIEYRNYHMLPPLLQIDEDGTLWWFAGCWELVEPEASAFKASVIRNYIKEVEEARL